MGVDPSIILGIQNQQPDAAALFATAYKLKAMQQEQQQNNALKSFLSNPDSLGPDGLPTKNALSGLIKTAPQVGFKVAEETAKIEGQRERTSDEAIATAVKKDNILNSNVRVPAANAYEEALKDGKTPAEAKATAQKVYSEAVEAEKGSGIWSREEADKFAPDFDIDRVRAGIKTNAAHNTPKGSDVETLTDASGTTFDHNKVTGQNTTLSGKPYDPEGATHKIGGAGDTGGLDEEGVKYYAEQFRTLGPTSLGRLNKADRDKVINYAAADAGGDAQSDIRTQYAGKGAQAEQRSEGTRTGQLRIAEEEMEGAVDLSSRAYQKLPRGEFTPFNELQNLVEKKTSSPEQAAAYAADNAIVNIYARMISPTGQGTDSDKNHAREMLNQAQGPEAHQAVLNQLMAEGKNALAKAQKARAETTAETPTATPGHQHTQAGPPAHLLKENVVTTFKNGQKWTLRGGKPEQVH